MQSLKYERNVQRKTGKKEKERKEKTKLKRGGAEATQSRTGAIKELTTRA